MRSCIDKCTSSRRGPDLAVLESTPATHVSFARELTQPIAERGSQMFKKSSMCGSTTCVEVDLTGAVVRVRDTKNDGDGPTLEFTHAEWQAFVMGVKLGEFEADFVAG